MPPEEIIEGAENEEAEDLQEGQEENAEEETPSSETAEEEQPEPAAEAAERGTGEPEAAEAEIPEDKAGLIRALQAERTARQAYQRLVEETVKGGKPAEEKPEQPADPLDALQAEIADLEPVTETEEMLAKAVSGLIGSLKEQRGETRQVVETFQRQQMASELDRRFIDTAVELEKEAGVELSDEQLQDLRQRTREIGRAGQGKIGLEVAVAKAFIHVTKPKEAPKPKPVPPATQKDGLGARPRSAGPAPGTKPVGRRMSIEDAVNESFAELGGYTPPA